MLKDTYETSGNGKAETSPLEPICFLTDPSKKKNDVVTMTSLASTRWIQDVVLGAVHMFMTTAALFRKVLMFSAVSVND